MPYTETFPYDGANDLYAKPVSAGSLPSNSPSWAADAIDQDSAGFGAVVFDGLTTDQTYWVYEQVGGSKANTDPVLGDITDGGDLSSIQAKVNLIGSQTTFIGPPVLSVTTPIDLIIGDDYKVANGREISFEFDAITGFTIGTAIGKFGGKKTGSETVNFFLVTTGTSAITDVGGGRWKVVFEVDQTDTATKSPGPYDWSVEIAQGGEEITVGRNGDTRSRINLRVKQT
jgi:hypothetical protein